MAQTVDSCQYSDTCDELLRAQQEMASTRKFPSPTEVFILEIDETRRIERWPGAADPGPSF
jgi:hypothetical protein